VSDSSGFVPRTVEWVSASILILRGVANAPHDDVFPQWRRDAENYFVLRATGEPEWGLLVQDSWAVLESIPQHRALVAAMRDDPQIERQLDQLVGDASGRTRLDTVRVLRSLLIEAIRRSGGLVDSRETSSGVARDFEQALRKEVVEYTILAPLPAHGLAIEKQPIQLDSDTSIDALTDEEIAAVLSAGFRFDVSGTGILGSYVGEGLGIRVSYSLPRLVGESGPSPNVEDRIATFTVASATAEAKVYRAIAAMRLLKSGLISVGGVVHTTRDVLSSSSSHRRSILRRPTTPRDEYALQGDDSKHLVEIYSHLAELDDSNRATVKMALRRFVGSSERFDSEDRLVDLLICAEALFAGDPKDAADLSYKLSLRCAYYLSRDANERRTLFRHMRRAYSARSNIVHGNRREGRVQRSIERGIEELPETEQALRTALRRLLTYTSEESDTPVWDDLVLEGKP
jgi:hypothetical protein